MKVKLVSSAYIHMAAKSIMLLRSFIFIIEIKVAKVLNPWEHHILKWISQRVLRLYVQPDRI